MYNEKRFERIYEDSNDIHTRKVILYLDDGGYACVDEDKTERIDATTLLDLFRKGMIIGKIDDGHYALPVGCSYKDGCTTVVFTHVSEGNVSPVLVHSKEYTGE